MGVIDNINPKTYIHKNNIRSKMQERKDTIDSKCISNINKIYEIDNKCNYSNKTDCFDNCNMRGGANKTRKITEVIKTSKKRSYFISSYKLYIIADATNNKLIRSYFAQLDKLKIDKLEQKNIRPHITMMEILVNRNHYGHKYMVDNYGQINNTLRMLLTTKYEELSPQMYLDSKKGQYDIMGDFLARLYKSSNPSYITKFRITLYAYLEIMLGKGERIVKKIDNKKYFVYSYGGKELIAVPEYYHGHGKWAPHLSIVKLDKIQRYNYMLYKQYQKFGINALIDVLSGTGTTMEHLNMSYHFNSLRISVVRS